MVMFAVIGAVRLTRPTKLDPDPTADFEDVVMVESLV
jgi:hypothetical protein